MDAAGGADSKVKTAFYLIAQFLLVFASLQVFGQAPVQQNPETFIQTLIAQERWQEIIRAVQVVSNRTAEDEYAYGLALASTGRSGDAKKAFERGLALNPKDSRFLSELGGLAFQSRDYRQATDWLTKAHQLKPSDEYVTDFLGTVYFLQDNLEAALKYWNKVGKPRVEAVRFEPQARLDPVLLDRAVAFAPGDMLTLTQLRATQARLEQLEVLSRVRIELRARADGKFDVVIRTSERNGFGDGKLEAILNTFRGAWYETVTPEYYNIGGRAMNLRGLARFDAEKRRYALEMSGPVRRKPQWRYRAGFDLRNENWNVTNFTGAGGQVGSFNLRRDAISLEMSSASTGRFSWQTGGEFARRSFRSVTAGTGLDPILMRDGNSLKQTTRVSYEVVRIPEKHYALTATAGSELGRMWGPEGGAFGKIEGGVVQRWSASSKGDDLVFRHSMRAGRGFGELPFDELFMLGVERDNPLWLRGHAGTADGRKGSAPMGRRYVLSNFDFQKKVWSNGLLGVNAGPFVDTGKITDPLVGLGSSKWLWDIGAQAKIKVLGVSFVLSYGRDLRGGNGVFYASVGK